MAFFGLGRLFYVFCLLTNAIAILSEDRFLARSTYPVPSSSIPSTRFPPKYQPTKRKLTLSSLLVGFGRPQADSAFGATYDGTSVKAKSVNLIASVRTVMRSMSSSHFSHPFFFLSSVYNTIMKRTEGHSTEIKLIQYPPTVPLIVINTIIIVYELILG